MSPGLEAEFRGVYRAPGVRHLGYGCLLAASAPACFYLLDATNGDTGWLGESQTLRLLTVLVLGGIGVTCLRNAPTAQRYYAPLLIAASLFGASMGAAISFVRLADASPIQLMWSLNTTMALVVIIIHGFSRLGVLATAVMANAGSVLVLALLWHTEGIERLDLRRIVVHLFVVGICCAWLRLGIENRERELFLLAKENLRRNEHTRELEAAIRSAQEADATKSKFLAHMSHEIRTPMNGVLQILELIGSRAPAADRELIAKGQKAGHALLSILNGVLDYAKLAHQGVSVRPTVTDLRDVCRTAAHLHEATSAVKGIAFRTDLELPADGNATVLVDAVKLLELINNLVANGIKFTQDGEVALGMRLTRDSTARRGSATLQVTVRDTGPGMEANERRQAFQPFYQGPSPTRRAGGTGLGLAIVKQIVDEMRGRIEVDSEIGRGTEFRLFLPVERVTLSLDGRDAGFAVPTPALGAEFAGKRVLLVEDNELNAELAAQILALIGFDVDVADSGAVALQRLTQSRYDVVLMDCQMPGMDGYETVQLWRATESAQGRERTPIIAVTAYTLLGDRRKCLQAGMDDFLGKPYTAVDLAERLRRWT